MLKNRKIIAIVIAICVILVALFVIPTSLGTNDIIYTSFGQFRVEVSNVDSITGEEVFMKPSSILGDMLEFTRAGIEVNEINVKIFVTATGEGFDACEFDLSESSKRPQINTRLMEGDSVIDTDTQTYSGNDYWIAPLGSEQLFWEYTCDINEFESSFDTSDDHSFVVEISFDYPECTYRGKCTGGGTGDTIDLPVEGTSDISWEQTWTSPVYMGDFTYTATSASDVHNKYKNADSYWVEFDTNYWNYDGIWTDTIDDYVYGIHLGGWVSGTICTYHWTQYTDASGGICTSVPLGGTSCDDGDWQTSDVSFIIETGASLEWNVEVSCGDGWCNFGPYPEENCATCPSDCGSCDAEMKNVYTTVGSGLTKDDRGLAFHYGYDDYSWSDWGNPTAPYSIEVFKNADAWDFWVWTGDGTSGKILKSSCKILCSGITYYPIMCTWSEDGAAVSPGNWYEIGYWTEWEEDHVLLSNSQYYKLYLDIWLEGGTNAHTLIVNANNHNDNTVIKNTATGASDSSVPYQFELINGESYTIVADWYGNGVVVSTTSGTMGSSDKTITMDHPNNWAIGVVHAGTNGPYSTKVDSEIQYGNFACFYRQNGVYTVYGYDGDGNEKTNIATLNNNDFSFVFNWFIGLQIYSGGTFSIVDTGSNDYIPYTNGENYLGVI